MGQGVPSWAKDPGGGCAMPPRAVDNPSPRWQPVSLGDGPKTLTLGGSWEAQPGSPLAPVTGKVRGPGTHEGECIGVGLGRAGPGLGLGCARGHMKHVAACCTGAGSAGKVDRWENPTSQGTSPGTSCTPWGILDLRLCRLRSPSQGGVSARLWAWGGVRF